ncbi:MAG: HAMP domain-containing histidine kinase [Lachnospiraceae bacterium]|nr:HAMP domain-containing histidine kinase [Lachnospiraceae bacterium]
MIQKLRRQFIIVAMCSTFAVLAIIIGALNIVNYYSVTHRTDVILGMLSQNDGKFPNMFEFRRELETNMPAPPEDEKLQEWGRPDFRNDFRKNFSREVEYETRYFSVRVGNDGSITSDLGMIAAVEEDAAQSYAQTILKKYQKKGTVKGFINDYRYLVTETGDGYQILFVDCATVLQNARKVLVASVSVSFMGLLAVFALVLFFSKKVFRPVETSYQKQRQFITDASHELKTPLTIISANIEVMEMEAEESQWSKSIKKQVDRLVSLVEQMVTLSRLDEQQETVYERFSLSDAVRDTADLYLPVAESKGDVFELEIEDGIQMKGDEKQIRQMVGLLLDNAMKYAARKPAGEGSKESQNMEGDPEKPRICLTLTSKGKKAQLRLWNTTDQDWHGNQDALFERFYRPDSSRNSKKGGSGIGLSIVKSIVEAHHGKITASGKEDGSIEFKASLPLNI